MNRIVTLRYKKKFRTEVRKDFQFLLQKEEEDEKGRKRRRKRERKRRRRKKIISIKHCNYLRKGRKEEAI